MPPFKLSSWEPKEQDVHESCAKALHHFVLKPAEWTCFPAGHVQLNPAQAARLSRSGLARGWPDFLVVYAGSIYGLEIKRPGMSLSKTRIVHTKRGSPRVLVGQDEMFPRLVAAGMKITLVEGVKEMLWCLREWGIPLRAYHF